MVTYKDLAEFIDKQLTEDQKNNEVFMFDLFTKTHYEIGTFWFYDKDCKMALLESVQNKPNNPEADMNRVGMIMGVIKATPPVKVTTF
jgi:hypothetical protein